MSSWFKLELTVTRYQKDKLTQIQEAARKWWDFTYIAQTSHPLDTNLALCLEGEDKCSADPTEWFNKMSEEIWKANGGHCEIQMRYLCLDDLPWETYKPNDSTFFDSDLGPGPDANTE